MADAAKGTTCLRLTVHRTPTHDTDHDDGHHLVAIIDPNAKVADAAAIQSPHPPRDNAAVPPYKPGKSCS
jgi:hypothetical protein